MAYTNPGSIIRFSSRKGGRASIYENNAQYQQHSTGVFSGSGATQNTSADMNIIVGGALGTSGSDGYIPAASPANPNVLIGKNANGYKIMLDVVGTTLLQITKPAQNSRISLVVAYTDDLSIQSAETSDTGNPAKNGIIVVNGQSLANPVPPSDSDIRTAITADGAAGSQAVYAIIARITVASNTTTITNTMIAVDSATIPSQSISFSDRKKINANPSFGDTFTNTTDKPIVLTWFLSIVVQANSSTTVDAGAVTIGATNLSNYSNMSMRAIVGGNGLTTGLPLVARGVLAPGATSKCSYWLNGGAYQIPSAIFCPIPSPVNLFDFS